MESLYKLQNHVIVYEKDNNVITFLKDISIDSIIIENDGDNSFEFTYNNKIYTNNEFYIDKIYFDENGKYIISEYCSRDTNITLKEVFRYVLKDVIERYYIINIRNGGFISDFNILTSKIRLNEETEVISPLSSNFIINKNKEYTQANAPFYDSGMLLFKNSLESLHIWYYNNNNGANLNYKDNKLVHSINFNKKINRKEDIVIGAVYYKFYKGNYLESLEKLQNFYKNNNNSQISTKKLDYNKKNGAFSYIKEETLYNSSFSNLVSDIYNLVLPPNDIIRWLQIEESIIPFNQPKLIYGIRKRGYSDYPIQFKKMMYNFTYILGNPDIFRENSKTYESYNRSFNENIIKNGRIVTNVLRTDNKNIVAFIKRYNNSFYLTVFNFTPFKENVNISLNSNFVEEYLSLNYYKIIDELEDEVLFVKRDVKTLNLTMEPYDSKVLSFKFNSSKVVEGKQLKLIQNNDIITIENNFYRVFLTKNSPLIQSLTTDSIALNQFESNLYLKKDKFEVVINETTIAYTSKNFKIRYNYNGSNKISVSLNANISKRNNYLKFSINNFNYLMQNNKIIENKQNLDLDKTVSIIGGNLVLLDNFNSKSKNLDISLDGASIFININKNSADINKIDINFDLILL